MGLVSISLASAVRNAGASEGASRLEILEPAVPNVLVRIDDEPLPRGRSRIRRSVEPGMHRVHAEASIGGVPFTFDREVTVPIRRSIVVEVVLLPANPELYTAEEVQCLLGAKDPGESARCLAGDGPPAGARPDSDAAEEAGPPKLHRMEAVPSPSPSPSSAGDSSTSGNALVETVAFDVGGYSDTTHVNVLSPGIRASIASPTAGWRLGGSYLVDVVSAASPDIVSEASPPFHEVRQAGSLRGGYRAGPYDVGANAIMSSESDYLSIGGGLSLAAEWNDKNLTPSIGVDYSHDTIGRGTTPFSVFHHVLETAVVEGGVTFVLSPSSILLVGGTLQFERGDQSKPYRYIPMFDPATAPLVTPGQSYASVNRARESISPLEQLPLSRDRFSLGARFAHRSGRSTLRLEQVLYHDNWQQSATTTDARYLVDLSERFRAGPHLRFYAQNGVSFYRLAYAPGVDPNTNQIAIPDLRTSDRESGPMIGLTAGGALRCALTEPTGSTPLAITVQLDILYSMYFQALYITSRTATYGTLGFEAGFE